MMTLMIDIVIISVLQYQLLLLLLYIRSQMLSLQILFAFYSRY